MTGPPGHLGVGDEVVVAELSQHEAGEVRPASVGGVDPSVLVDRLVAVGCPDPVDEVGDLPHVGRRRGVA